jgi:hypothetical protein
VPFGFSAFTTLGTGLNEARGYHTSTVIGNRLYVFGGNAASESSIARATISGNNVLGAFGALEQTMLHGRLGAALVNTGSKLYFVGGESQGQELGSTEVAGIVPDDSGISTLGGFTEGPALNVARRWPRAIATNQYLYVIGGGQSTSVERAVIHSDGSLGSFQLDPNPSVHGRQYHELVRAGKFVYAIGGEIQGAYDPTVERCVVNPDGTLGPWSLVDGVNLVQPRGEFSTAVIGNYLYVFDGFQNGQFVDTIEVAAIDGFGNMGPFSTVAGAHLNITRDDHTTQILGDYLYVIGGDGEATIERATLQY